MTTYSPKQFDYPLYNHTHHHMTRKKSFQQVFWMLFCITAFIAIGISMTSRPDSAQIADLKGDWKFSIGDNPDWASHVLDDSDWKQIAVPAYWEEQGYEQYNGYAWYRRNFKLPASARDQSMFLRLGKIDDVDEVYVNGCLIGKTGDFPPKYKTAYFQDREYPLRKECLQFKGDAQQENVIAIRVYDAEQNGGLFAGKEIGIFTTKSEAPSNINLAGTWKFKTGDDMSWKEYETNDSDWATLTVPRYWEHQGYQDYDGYAWYRKHIHIPATLSQQNLVVLLGKIDDVDQLYINGHLIGGTGDHWSNQGDIQGNEWQEFRGYYIPKEVWRADSDNVIAVRIFDAGGDGGFHQGPIGIMDQANYISYWRSRKKQSQKDWFKFN